MPPIANLLTADEVRAAFPEFVDFGCRVEECAGVGAEINPRQAENRQYSPARGNDHADAGSDSDRERGALECVFTARMFVIPSFSGLVICDFAHRSFQSRLGAAYFFFVAIAFTSGGKSNLPGGIFAL